MDTINPLDIAKRLHVKQNVTIRVIDEPTGKVVQEHVGHNAATNSLLTGIAHYLMGDGVLNQGSDTLMLWVPQYISLGTMGLTSQNSETLDDGSIVPSDLGYTPIAPESATEEEKELNAELRFTEYLNQTPGFGADGYDGNANNNREWFGLGYPYSLKPNKLSQDFYDGGQTDFVLSSTSLTKYLTSATFYGDGTTNTFPDDATGFNPVAISIKSITVNGAITTDYSFVGNKITLNTTPANGAEIIVNYFEVKSSIISVVAYDGIINQDSHNTSIIRSVFSVDDYSVSYVEGTGYVLSITNGTTPAGRVAIIYTVDSKDAANCELIEAKLDRDNNIVPLTLRSKITYRDLVPEVKSEIPNTLDVIYSAYVSLGALKEYRGDNDYIYITEAGLWAKPAYTDNGDNGLLAGYRIMPSDDEVNTIGIEKSFPSTGEATYNLVDDNNNPLPVVAIDSITCDGVVIPKTNYSFQVQSDATILTFMSDSIPESGSTLIMIYRSGDNQGTWKDMSVKENRELVQKSIIRVGINQVAQIIWKIQLGGLEQLNGLRYLYPSQYPDEVWEIVN